MFHVPNHWRVRKGKMGSDELSGNNGAFMVPMMNGVVLNVIASNGEGWEHVSVSTPYRCPAWDEMAFIKSVFWDDEDCAMQLHPPASDHVNVHPYCLHLWRPMDAEIPRPPKWMIG